MKNIFNLNNTFQFGFEIEYSLAELAPLLRYYYPANIQNLSQIKWLSLSDEENDNIVNITSFSSVKATNNRYNFKEIYEPFKNQGY